MMGKKRIQKSYLYDIESSSQYQQEMHDKLDDLWSQMKYKKNQIIKSVVPSYSRKKRDFNQTSRFDISNQHHQKAEMERRSEEIQQKLELAQNEILKLKNTLTVEIRNSKVKDIQIQTLKSKIQQILNRTNFNQKHEGSRRYDSTQINIIEHRFDKNKQNISYRSNVMNESSIINKSIKQLQNLHNDVEKSNSDRLLQILRSTQQYKQFVFYYDNNELSFLRNLGQMRRKNCACNLSERQKTLWAPKDVLEILKELNQKDKMGLNNQMIQRIVYNLNLLYLQRQKIKLQDIQNSYQKKLKFVQRKINSSIPYDIIQIQRHKQRELLKTKTRSKSTLRK